MFVKDFNIDGCLQRTFQVSASLSMTRNKVYCHPELVEGTNKRYFASLSMTKYT